MRHLPVLLALFATVLAGPTIGRAQELPCKNHFILRCPENTVPLLEWSSLPAPILDHGTGVTATLLADGRVLLAGGLTAGNGAELFDPASGTWTLAAPMNHIRTYHRTLRLRDGRVLVVGGNSHGQPYDATATVEIFDPRADTWTSASPPLFPRRNWRADHTLTQLHDGTVLLTGGSDLTWSGERRAEIFDPGTGGWKPMPAFASWRVGHTATLLPDGKVLVVGGVSDWDMWFYTPGAEVYDPLTCTWARLEGPAVVNHTTTLLADGRVLVAGGQANTPVAGVNAPAGAMWPYGMNTRAWLFEPATGRWKETRPLSSERHDHLAIPMPNGDVFATGGHWSSMPIVYAYAIGTVPDNERFDVASETWQPVVQVGAPPDLPETATTLLDGTVLVTSSRAAARLTFRSFPDLEPPRIAR